MDAGAVAAGGFGAAGADRAAGRMRVSGTNEIVRRVGVSKPTVIAWKRRYRRRGHRRAGRPAQVGAAAGDRSGGDRAGHAGAAAGAARGDALVEPAAGQASGHQRLHGVARRGRSGGCSRGGCRRSSSPPTRELEAKIRDVVGLYLNPPDKAIVLCIDEKSQVQALDRTAPVLPLRLGMPEKQTHDYVRHGTTTLFAALEVATGKVTDACYPRHRHEEFLRFLKQVAKAYPRRKLHIVVRQLRHPQAPGRAGLAGEEPADHAALHPDQRVLAEHGRDLLRHHHPAGHPPRHLHQRQRPHRRHRESSSTAGTNAANPSSGPRPPTTSSREPPAVNTLQ